LVKYTQINHDNFSKMFSLSLSLYLPYIADVCNEFYAKACNCAHLHVDRNASIDVEAVTTVCNSVQYKIGRDFELQNSRTVTIWLSRRYKCFQLC